MNIMYADFEHWACLKFRGNSICDLDSERCMPRFIKKECIDCYWSDKGGVENIKKHNKRIEENEE